MKEEIKAYVVGLAGVFLLAMSITLLISPQTHAGLFTSAMTSSWDTIDSKYYKLDAYGFDARVYEWTPLGNPNMRCVFVASNKSSGVGCYPAIEQ
jgi:hypothetical protein